MVIKEEAAVEVVEVEVVVEVIMEEVVVVEVVVGNEPQIEEEKVGNSEIQIHIYIHHYDSELFTFVRRPS